ncbi:hypothetical protein EVAR_13700_1 [Eumeta japonica]|uniref:Uncharacterized protein n=1 Tax=Eumeta variegata TaxID=151549 RepID=A0A4C1UCU4_EUMVA|nr:hypothetical protein EVAR_13700_1 [Eumeta japonica]
MSSSSSLSVQSSGTRSVYCVPNCICTVPSRRVVVMSCTRMSVCGTVQCSPCGDRQATCVYPECSLRLTIPSARRALARFLCLEYAPTKSRFQYPIEL